MRCSAPKASGSCPPLPGAPHERHYSFRAPQARQRAVLTRRRWFGFLTDQMIRRVHTSIQALESDIRTWIQTWNEDPRPFMWTKTAEEILYSLAEYIAKISGAEH